MLKLRHAAVAIALTLAACSGGGGGSSSPAPVAAGSTTTTPATPTQTAQLKVHIGGTTTSSSQRRAQFVSASTQGILVDVYASSDTTHQHLLAATATNVAPGSAACGGATGARTCVISIAAPAGADDFVFTDYDQPPNGATTFPPSANVLAVGTVYNQNIVVASANIVNVSLGGSVASLQIQPAAWSLLAGPNGTNLAGSYSLEVTAFDSDNNAIIAGASDPYSTPITVAVTETATTPCAFPIVPADCSSGPTGHTSITLGGPTGTGSSSVQVTQSNQVVTVLYDGRGDPSYAAHFAATSGIANASAVFNPMFVDSGFSGFTPGVPGTLAVTPGQQAFFNLRGGGGSDFTAGEGTCTGIATVTVQPGDGNAARYGYITGGTTPGTCQASFADGFGTTYAINVTLTSNTSANVAVPGSTLAYLSQQAAGVTIDTLGGTQVGTIATASSADDIALDDAGDVFVLTNPNSSTSTPGSFAKYVPSGSGYPPAYTRSSATYTMSDPMHVNAVLSAGNGLVVAQSYNSSNSTLTFDIWSPGAQGSPTRTITRVNAGSNPLPPNYGYLRHDGTLVAPYAVSCAAGTSTCIKYDIIDASSGTITRTFAENLVAVANQPNFYPNYVVLGPDGTLYVSEWEYTNDPIAGIYIYPGDGSTERYSGQWMLAPDGLDIDATGNIYAVNNNSMYLGPNDFSADTDHSLNEVSPDGQTLIRSVQIAPNSAPLAVAADGTAVFGQYTDSSLGAPGAVFTVAPGQYNPLQISTKQAANIVLYDGTRETLGKGRSALSIGSGTAHGGSTLHVRR